MNYCADNPFGLRFKLEIHSGPTMCGIAIETNPSNPGPASGVTLCPEDGGGYTGRSNYLQDAKNGVLVFSGSPWSLSWVRNPSPAPADRTIFLAVELTL